MSDILAGNFAPSSWKLGPNRTIRVVNWNIDRGLRLSEITKFLASQGADLLTLQEVDLNAKRTHGLNIAEELARKLRMNYVFGCEFEELTQGSRTSPAYHGQATLSRWHLYNSRLIRFHSQSAFWRPRWFLPRTEPFQERLGGRIALVTEVGVVGQAVIVYNLHLESRGNDDLRLSQFQEVLTDASTRKPGTPALVAGDLNFDISAGPAASLVRGSDFHRVLGQSGFFTRPPRKLFGSPRTIDWALASGPVEPAQGQIYSDVNASDHYPISFTLRLL